MSKQQDAIKRPNVVFILTDNQAWGDLSSYGCPYFKTPNIDQLAAEGVRFTHAYASAPMCTSSRDALYTGRYPGRNALGIREPLPMASIIGDKVGLSPDEPTIISLLKAQGYASALVGKWHCGHLPTYSPLKSGFDEYFGNKSGSIDYFRHVDASGTPDMWENDTKVDHAGQYVTDLYTDRAVEYIKRKRDKPFFLCLFYNAPHWPYEGPEDKVLSDSLKGKDNQRNWIETGTSENYAAVMERLDQGVGKVLAALKSAGIADDTLVIYNSDQGGDEFAHPGPFRRGRLHEQGIRVPLIVRWPGVFPEKKVTDQMVIGMDISATILDAAGAKPDPALPFDGENLRPIVTANKPSYARKFFWRHHGFPRPGIPEQGAFRHGEWKYYTSGSYERLYNLDKDVHEQIDLSEKQADLFKSMRDEYRRWAADMLPYEE